MKKTIYVIAVFMSISAICVLVINKGIAQHTCPTWEVNNTHAILDETEQESCGECIWFTITPGWKPGDPASSKWTRNRAEAFGTVQKCKYKLGQQYQCTTILLTGEMDCPLDDHDPESPGGEH